MTECFSCVILSLRNGSVSFLAHGRSTHPWELNFHLFEFGKYALFEPETSKNAILEVMQEAAHHFLRLPSFTFSTDLAVTV